jgi:hypothetical protein
MAKAKSDEVVTTEKAATAAGAKVISSELKLMVEPR